MVVIHVITAPEAFAEVGALIVGQIGVAEIVVAVGIGGTVSINVVTSGFDSIMETTVPRLRPVSFRFLRRPRAWRRRTFLRMNGQRRSA
jgi:hypothetical protein